MLWMLVIITISLSDDRIIHKEIIGYFETQDLCETVKKTNPIRGVEVICVQDIKK